MAKGSADMPEYQIKGRVIFSPHETLVDLQLASLSLALQHTPFRPYIYPTLRIYTYLSPVTGITTLCAGRQRL